MYQSSYTTMKCRQSTWDSSGQHKGKPRRIFIRIIKFNWFPWEYTDAEYADLKLIF